MRRIPMIEGPWVEHAVALKVRFQEIDVLGMAWHGHYLSYFEEARVALCDRYGIGYGDMLASQLVAPIVKISCDYFAPARFNERLRITARLRFQRIARLDMFYEVRRLSDEVLLASGQSVQVFTEINGDMILSTPGLLERFLKACEQGVHPVIHG